MKSFKEYLSEEVKGSRRQSMLHLEKMKDHEFLDFALDVKKSLGGKLDLMSVNLKLDGLGARFGKDPSGKPFFETSRSGPVFKSGTFLSFTASRGGDEVSMRRASHYEGIFELITSSKFVKNLPNDTKVFAEIFYNPMAEIDDSGIKFVNIKYDRSKLGTLMSVFPLNIEVASTGEAHPDEGTIFSDLLASSTSKVLIDSNRLKVSEPIDISAQIKPLLSLQSNAKDILMSRKKADAENKKMLSGIIQSVKINLAKYILDNPSILNKMKLGPNIEGLVLNINGRDVKVTTPEFKTMIAKKK